MRADVLIVCILISNTFVYLVLYNNEITISPTEFALLMLINSFIVVWVINNFYERPIWVLMKNIQLFVVWELKDDSIFFDQSINPRLNYVWTFFWRALKTLRSIHDEFMHGKDIKSEVNLASEIQWKLLKKKLIEVPSFNIVASSTPAWEVWGDSYDIINHGDNYYIYVWDATWHWVWAWFVMVMVNALVSGFTKIFVSGADVLAHTNDILKPRIKWNILMSMLLVRWNEKEKRVFMTGSGHEYLIIYKNRTKKCHMIKSWWLALGMTKNIHWLLKEREIQFDENDIIILYSDGITEAIDKPKKDGSEEMFWETKLIYAVEKAPNMKWKNHKSAISIFNSITIELSKHMGYKHVQLDDITLAVIHYKDAHYKREEDFWTKIPDDFITEWKW